MEELCAQFGLSMPKILMEPGRSIVADAGLTLYTVGTLKEIKGFKSYVSIDGGMMHRRSSGSPQALMVLPGADSVWP